MLLIKSSKLSIPRSFSMSIIWKILTGLLLSLSLTFTAVFQNQVENILQLTTSMCQLMVFMAYALWYEELTRKRSWRRFSDLSLRFVLLPSPLHLSFLHLNFTITDSFFFKRWQACMSSGLTSCPVKESALQMFTLSSSALIEGQGLPPPILANGTEHF